MCRYWPVAGDLRSTEQANQSPRRVGTSCGCGYRLISRCVSTFKQNGYRDYVRCRSKATAGVDRADPSLVMHNVNQEKPEAACPRALVNSVAGAHPVNSTPRSLHRSAALQADQEHCVDASCMWSWSWCCVCASFAYAQAWARGKIDPGSPTTRWGLPVMLPLLGQGIEPERMQKGKESGAVLRVR